MYMSFVLEHKPLNYLWCQKGYAEVYCEFKFACLTHIQSSWFISKFIIVPPEAEFSRLEYAFLWPLPLTC